MTQEGKSGRKRLKIGRIDVAIINMIDPHSVIYPDFAYNLILQSIKLLHMHSFSTRSLKATSPLGLK